MGRIGNNNARLLKIDGSRIVCKAEKGGLMQRVDNTFGLLRDSYEEAETILLAKLNDPCEDHQRVRLGLNRLHRSCTRVVDALATTADYLAETSDLKARAEVYFHLGQMMERIHDWESARRWYTNALELEPRSRFYWYFLHNNLGFCLYKVKRFADAENYLHEAIGIDDTRANAFKNLGLIREGEGRYVEAAQSYVAAVRAEASDPRALRHLVELPDRHKEVFDGIPDLEYQIGKCREAVGYVARKGDKPM